MNLIIILLIGLVGYLIYQKSKGKSWNNIFGILLIGLGILFFEFSPDPISFGAYAIFHGISLDSINASNISSHLWKFEIWSCTVGLIMLVIGMNILGWNFKRIWKKINPGKYSIALIIAFFSVLLISIIDIYSAHSGAFGSYLDYTFGHYSAGWWEVFFKITLIIFAIPAICYYYFVRKDISESLGVFIFSFILFWGGISDIGYFVFQGLNLPSQLPWLNGSPFIGFITKQLGYPIVTNVSLLFSAFVSILCAWIIAKVMKEKL